MLLSKEGLGRYRSNLLHVFFKELVMKRSLWFTGLGVLGAWMLAAVAQAADYPEKPVRLIVPFATGGTTDLVARAMAQKMGDFLGQPVKVENQVGGGGVTGSDVVAKAPPDGYVLGMATVSTHASNPAINPAMPYNPVADFSHITNIAVTPNVIAVHPSFPAKDYADFMAALMQSPGKYSYASAGVGVIGHMQMELFKRMTSTVITHVPYSGGGPALADTAAGKVPMMFDNLPSALPYISQGKLIPIAVASPQRLAFLPKVPTFVELGLDPVNRMAFYGLVGPKGLSADVVDTIHHAALKALADPEVKRRIEATGSIIHTTTAPEFRMQIEAEYAVYKKVAKERKLKFNPADFTATAKASSPATLVQPSATATTTTDVAAIAASR